MSKYRYLRELLREAYPLYNPKMTDEIMRRVKDIRDTKKDKQAS